MTGTDIGTEGKDLGHSDSGGVNAVSLCTKHWDICKPHYLNSTKISLLDSSKISLITIPCQKTE